MKNYVFIVTNNENHWSDMTNILKEKAIPFYPEKIEDFNKLRNYCNFDHCIKKECSTKARNEIKKIISKYSEKIPLFDIIYGRIFLIHRDNVYPNIFYYH